MRTHVTYIVIIIILAFLAFMFKDQYLKNKADMVKLESAITEKNAIIKYHKNKEGRLVAEKQAAELKTSQLIQAYPAVVEEIRKEFDVKIKDMKAYVRNEFVAHGQGNATINHYHYTDSTGVTRSYLNLKVSDGYLDFGAKVYEYPLSSPYEYVYSDTATTVISARKKWLFGKETLWSSTRFRNPNAKVAGTVNILVDNYRDKRWGVMVGLSWLPTQLGTPVIQQFQPTVTVGYNLFRF